MGIFFKIFHLFEKNEPHHELLEAYAKAHELSLLLHQALKLLRKVQKEMVEKRVSAGSSGTGGIGLQKTLFIEEELIPELKKISQETESRFLKAGETIKKSQPLSPLEKEELREIINFLEKIRSRLPELEKVFAAKSDRDKLLAVETALRETVKLAEEFHRIKSYEKSLARRVLTGEISPLLRRMYHRPDVRKYTEKGAVKYLYTYTLSKRELRKLEEEARRVNACQDPNYEIKWRRWWRDIQKTESDEATGLEDPHINVTLRLFGQKKKDIHLLLAA